MNIRALLGLPLNLVALLTRRIASPLAPALSSGIAYRSATTMSIDSSKMSVLEAPLQPLTKEGDSSHPTGYQRDGYCWGIRQDPGQHYVGAVVTDEFLRFSKENGNDLMTPRPGFAGLKDGCKWCLCVNRWKEALTASDRLGERVVPRVDLSATALASLKTLKMEDLQKHSVSK
ncbi:uncharacterized protein MKK02DRAFT_42703 [Dioszegia hungarica]|uniref:Uncharacterized protein n=1 Tax=Dioszegia hungarica TaxID=4972 RepID=A0AA38HDA8_9TREE|nr:uncharacterized protein MKK02DRAFT_42703 [Dioszegia hungarica]KAI9638316.1 hypothetical protein MKK02DRAFT_42703 [Dioszegia hungarica]